MLSGGRHRGNPASQGGGHRVHHPSISSSAPIGPGSSPPPPSPGCSCRRPPRPDRRVRTRASDATTTSTTSCSSASPWRVCASTRRRSRRSPTPTAAPGSTRRPGTPPASTTSSTTMAAAGWDVEVVPFDVRARPSPTLEQLTPVQASYDDRRVHRQRRRRRHRPTVVAVDINLTPPRANTSGCDGAYTEAAVGAPLVADPAVRTTSPASPPARSRSSSGAGAASP